MFPKKDLWYISASTGCTCCSYENFDEGFYEDEETPYSIIVDWEQGKSNPLASQYAKYGRYSVHKVEAEILPDGRMIINDTVFDKDFFGHIDW